MKTFLTVQEAAEVILGMVPDPEPQEVPLGEACGCVLAQDVRSDLDMPPWDKSAMDGYAVRAADVREVPAELEVVEEIPAGAVPKCGIGPGQCAKIMTGAPLPAGADAVVMVEHTEPAGPGRVRIRLGVSAGTNVCARGEDVRRGDVVLVAGSAIRPQEMAVLAAVGAARVRVYRKPVCAMIATGDELVRVEDTPGPGQIRNSNSYNIAAQVRAMGLRCDDLGIARDTLADLRARIREGLQRDVLILSGGVSAGDYDYVIAALEQEGVDGVLHQVWVKPGRPFYFGRRGRQRVFALPGNPVSTFVLFELFVRLFLGRMMGLHTASRPRQRLRLLGRYDRASDRVQVVPARVSGDGVEPVPWHGSADIFALTRADALMIVPANAGVLEPGAVVDVLILDPLNRA